LNYFYGKDLVGKFKDVRTADRALTIQENSVNSRWKTMDEMRFAEGLPPLDNSDFPGMGAIPVYLANNPSFVSTFYQLGGVDGGNIEAMDGVGNLNESQAPEQMVNQLATDDVVRTAVLTELKRWRKVAKGSLRDTGYALSKSFETTIIPEYIYSDVERNLQTALSEDDVDTAFKMIKEGF
jgi:hypothetical protein